MKTWILKPLLPAILIVLLPFSAPAGVKGNGKKVFGYLTFSDTKWGSSGGQIPVDSLPWDVLTHATLFAASGSVPIPSSYLNQLPSLAQKAHQSDVYAGLCYGGSGDAPLISTVNNTASWPAWIDYNLGLIDNYKLDFLEFDLESSVSVTNVRSFFEVLYDSLQTRRSANNPSVAPFIVLTVGPSRAASWVSVEPFVGHVNLMSYDYIGDWWGRTIHDFSPKSYQYWNGTGTNIDYYSGIAAANRPAPSMQEAALRVRAAGWPSDKIVVGFDINPTYWSGGTFPGGRGPTYIREPTSGNTQTAGSALDFSSQWPTLSQIPADSIHFDQIAQTYWAHTGTGLSDDKLWVMGALPGRDSAVWATRQVVDSMDIGGVMFWNLGNEVWNTSSVPPGGRGWFFSQIRRHFGGAQSPPPPPDLIPPTVRLSNPAAGDTVTGTVVLQAEASDNVAVVGVQFHVNGSAIGSAVTSVPYSRSWNTAGLAGGPYRIRATAYDAAGLSSSDSVTVFVVPPPPPPPGDTVAPATSVTAPAGGDTVSGTVQVNVVATDASGITVVKLMVDGAFTGMADATSPYGFSWNSTTVADGPHTLGAEATDGAGLKSTAAVGIVVHNAAPPPPPPPPPDTAVVSVYNDQLVSPWVNASWGAVNTFTSPEQVYEGSYSIKSVQNGWGAVSVHSGSWGSPVGVNTAGFDSLEFAVYPETTGLSLAVSFENDVSGAFPAVVRSNIPAKRWTLISIPVADLNPAGQVVHRLNIQNNTSQTRTYFMDHVVLGADTAAAGGTSLGAPSLLSPANGSIDQVLQPQLSWNAVAGAATYELQVALDRFFDAVVAGDQAVSGTSAPVGPLESGIVYFWRVRATGAGAQGAFSETFSFTTSSATAQVLKYDRLFVDFGKVPIGTAKTDSVVIENNGTSQRKIIGVSTSSNLFDATAGDLIIPAGGSQKLFISYRPTKKSNDASRVISVIDSTNTIDTIRVVGNGVNAPKQRNRHSIVFANVPPEEVGTQDVYVANDGDLDLTIMSVTATLAGVSVSPSSATIAPHDSVPFTVSVSPHGRSGKITGFLVFSNNGLLNADSIRIEATISGPGAGESSPDRYSLSQNYPNPFNPTTTIGFALPRDSRVTIRVYNLLGEEVSTVYEGDLAAGYGSVEWDGRSSSGTTLASGVYYYRIEAVSTDGTGEAFIDTRRMVLLR
jgi:hypothetical protein